MASFEMQAGTLEEFLSLLSQREQEHTARANVGVVWSPDPIPRRAVYVADLHDAHPHSSGVGMSVKRYVIASFVYGEDLITYRRDVSIAHEVPDMPGSHSPAENRKRHVEAMREVRGHIERYLMENGIAIDVLDAFVRGAEQKGG